MEKKITFEDVVRYAELCGKAHRSDSSRAKDMSQLLLHNPYNNQNIMVLYEGERRTPRGHDKPEVCWICISPDGSLSSVPSRVLRQMGPSRGFGFWPKGREKLERVLNGTTTPADRDEIESPFSPNFQF